MVETNKSHWHSNKNSNKDLSSKQLFCRVPIKTFEWIRKLADKNNLLLSDVIRRILKYAEEELDEDDFL
jgi:hypothetical protein